MGFTTVKITFDEQDRRLDNFLHYYFKNNSVPKSLIYRLIRQGKIKVNKKKVKPSYKLTLNDQIKIVNIKIDESSDSNKNLAKNFLNNKNNISFINKIKNSILYEDNKILIINKPAGIAVHGGNQFKFGLIELLREIRHDLEFIELAHRLDRDTSGCLILAKSRSMLRALHALFRENKIEKKYILLTQNYWAENIKKINLALKRDCYKNGQRQVGVSNQGKFSETEFKVLKKFNFININNKNNNIKLSLVEAKLNTGRMHQIRVHCAAKNYKILGDNKYGDEDLNLFLKRNNLLKRLFLHASEIKFKIDNKILKITAPLDQELENFLLKLDE